MLCIGTVDSFNPCMTPSPRGRSGGFEIVGLKVGCWTPPPGSRGPVRCTMGQLLAQPKAGPRNLKGILPSLDGFWVGWWEPGTDHHYMLVCFWDTLTSGKGQSFYFTGAVGRQVKQCFLAHPDHRLTWGPQTEPKPPAHPKPNHNSFGPLGSARSGTFFPQRWARSAGKIL